MTFRELWHVHSRGLLQVVDESSFCIFNTARSVGSILFSYGYAVFFLDLSRGAVGDLLLMRFCLSVLPWTTS